MLFHVVLYEPEIPPNTGNIIRLVANTPCQLHLIHPMGFNLSDKQVKRAGLDYHAMAKVQQYDHWQDFLDRAPVLRLWMLSTRGTQSHADVRYGPDDGVCFGPETRGLPQSILDHPAATGVLRIPMVPNSRSLNLSNAVAVVVYEAWRQQGFLGARGLS